jgi:hypothetical protein
MKILSNTLSIEIEKWSDPGDYPSGAGGGPLPSYDFVSDINGEIVFELEKIDIDYMEESEYHSIQEYLDDNPGELEHGIPGLTVSEWTVEKIQENKITVYVQEFEMDDPGPPEDYYDDRDPYEEEFDKRMKKIL